MYCILNWCPNSNYFSNTSRNHNAIGQIEQDPGIWPELAEVSRFVLNLRYQYLPFLYTLFHDVSKAEGDTSCESTDREISVNQE